MNIVTALLVCSFALNALALTQTVPTTSSTNLVITSKIKSSVISAGFDSSLPLDVIQIQVLGPSTYTVIKNQTANAITLTVIDVNQPLHRSMGLRTSIDWLLLLICLLYCFVRKGDLVLVLIAVCAILNHV